MKRMVLGMMVVFFVQAGFIAYTAIERQSEEILAENGIPAIWDATKKEPLMVADAEPSTTGPDRLPGAANTENAVVFASEKRSRRQSAAPQFPVVRRTHPGVRATTAVFEPQIIKVPKAEPRTGQPWTTTSGLGTKETKAFSKTVARAEKRSFAAKSVSILKKPYDWLKAVASRMW